MGEETLNIKDPHLHPFIQRRSTSLALLTQTSQQQVNSRWRAALAQKRPAVLRNTRMRRHAASQAHSANQHAGQTP